MKIDIRNLLFLSLLVLLGSCNKFFEPKPQDFYDEKSFFNTEKQLENVLASVYSPLGGTELYGGRMIARMGLDADEAYYNSSVFANTGVSIYDLAPTDQYTSAAWTACYKAINRANLLLANIDKPEMSEKRREVIKGETLFLRGYYYLLLTSNFGDVPLTLTPTLSASQPTAIPQVPSKQVYEQILKDMKEAEALVEDAFKVGFGGRINKSAVQGVLARVCLYMAGNPINDASKYEEAREWALKVIEPDKHALNPDFTQVFKNYAQDKYDIKESIWEVEFYGSSQDIYNETGFVGNYNGIRYTANPADPEYGRAEGYLNITPTLWNLYPNATSLTSSDLRRDWSIAPFSLSGNPAVEKKWTINQIFERSSGKFRRVYEIISPKGSNTPQNFPLLRYSDVLLMFAEADNEVNGPTLEGLDAINQVRRRGYGKPIKTLDPIVDIPSSISYIDFLQEIKNERSRELSFECLRKRDLVRWNDFVPAMKQVYSDILDLEPAPSQTIVRSFINASKRDELWPIPAYDIGLNSALDQNYGW